MFQRLLVSTNLLDGLHRFVKCVPELAIAGVKQIIFLHGVPLRDEGGIPRINQEKVNSAKARLSAALPDTVHGIEVSIEVLPGRPADLILETAKKYQSDLVVMGMPIRTLLSEKLLGSTTLGVLPYLKIPQMILRPPLIYAFTQEELALRSQHLFRHLLIPYDGSPSANYLVSRLRQQLQAQQRSQPTTCIKACTLCWIIDQPATDRSRYDQQCQQAQTALTAASVDLRDLDLDLETQIRSGNSVQEVQLAAQEQDISAIAVSSKNVGKIWEWSIPSFAGEILRGSWFPVIFFPPES
jgi:nucleotide-binding universal stress UspA family protein